jgi:hypothetical protein
LHRAPFTVPQEVGLRWTLEARKTPNFMQSSQGLEGHDFGDLFCDLGCCPKGFPTPQGLESRGDEEK